MGLYDNYKQQNSREINRYVGAPVAEMQQVGAYLQDAYMQNREAYDTLGHSIDTANILESDKALFNDRMSHYRKAISQAAQAGNYEDMSVQVRQQARKFNADYQPFIQNMQAVAAEDKDLAERVAKGTLTGADAERIKRARVNYGGLKVDAQGRYINPYKARNVSNYVDVNSKILEVLKAVKPNKLTKSGMGGTISVDGGRYFVKSERGVEEVSPERVAEATALALSDPMVKAYMRQDAELDYAHLKNLNYEDLQGADFVDAKKTIPSLKGAAKQLADKNGIPFVEAFKQLSAQRAYENKVRAYQGAFANNMSYKDITIKDEIGEETAGSKEARSMRLQEAKIKAEQDAKGADLVFESNTTSAPEREFSEIRAGVEASTKELSDIDRQLRSGRLETIDRKKLMERREQIAGQLTQDKEMLLNNAKEVTKDLPDVIEGGILEYSATNPKEVGKRKALTRGAITKALAEGRVEQRGNVFVVKTDQGHVTLRGDSMARSFSVGFNKALGNVVDFFTGQTGAARKAADFFNDRGEEIENRMAKINKLNNVVDNYEGTVAEASKKRQGTNLSMGLKENHKSQLSDYYSANNSGFEIYKDGELVDGDLPASISVERLSTEKGANGNNILNIVAKDAKGKRIEGNFTAVLKGQNNLNEQLLKEYKTGTAAKVGKLTMDNPVFQKLNTAELNAPVSLPNPVNIGGHAIHGIRKEKSPNGNMAFYLLDGKGRKLQDSEGDIYLESAIEVANLLNRK